MPHRLPLVFAHGNGIPRPVYQKMLIGLSHRFIATGIDRFGHDPQYPVTEAWPRLLDQLRSHISSVGEPVTLLGHGSGGWLSLLAAYRMPELVSAVIMLDAPVPTLRQARLLGLLKQIGMGSIPAPVTGAGQVIPCGMLVGEQSRVTRTCGLAASRRLTGENLVRIDGSHLFPLERPLVAAKEVVRLHDRMVGLDPAYRLSLARKPAPVRSRIMQAFG